MSHRGDPGKGGARFSWTSGVVRAVIVIAASLAGSVFIPNWLIGYLSLRVAPNQRDLLVTAWWAVAFVACCWIFVRLQRTKG